MPNDEQQAIPQPMSGTPIDTIIAATAEPARGRMAALAAVVRAEAPQATERIAYGLPTWHQGENIVHLGAFQRHIGIYPGPEAISAFAPELNDFRTSKGAIQVPHDAPLPIELLRRIVRWRLAAIAERPGGRRA